MHIYSKAGTYTIKGTVYDASGTSSTIAKSTSVVAPSSPSIKILAPTSTISSSTNVHMIASGYAPRSIIAMQIYVDNILVYKINAETLDTLVTMAKGKHYVVVQMWQNDGTITKQPLEVTIQ